MSALEHAERVVRYGSLFSLMVLIWLSQTSVTFIATPTPISGFLVHLLIFFFLSGAFLVGWADHAAWIGLGFLVLSVVLEVAQVFLPGRTFSYVDLTGNLLGVTVGWLFFRNIRKFSRGIGT